MRLAELAARLDDFLQVDRYPAEDFAEIEELSAAEGIPLARYATGSFMARHNGLMLQNADDAEAVFTLVFPAGDVLSEVIRRARGRPALAFTHHPMDFETSGRGLVPVSTDLFERLRRAHVSLYSAHAPLDCHESVSTSRSLARALGVPAERACAGYMGGHAGVSGRIEPAPFADFAERVRAACGVDRVDSRAHSGTVERVAVVAGGAAFPALMQEAIDCGCDTYVTGDFRVRHGGAWAEEHRPQFDAFVAQAPLNLVGGSHYVTESLVMRDEMIDWFRGAGLAAEFVPQEDPWR